MNRNKCASLFKRFMSYFIDMLIIITLTFLLYFIIQMFSLFIGTLNGLDFVRRYYYYFIFGEFILINIIYFTVLPSTSFSSTFGQLLLGIKQVDKNGERLTYGKSLLKFLAAFLSKIIIYIGYIIVFFTENNRPLHEIITKTYLIER